MKTFTSTTIALALASARRRIAFVSLREKKCLETHFFSTSQNGIAWPCAEVGGLEDVLQVTVAHLLLSCPRE